MIQKNDYELYFLNNLYSDELISDMVSSFRNRLYHNIMNGKGTIQNNRIESGDVSSFNINHTLNYRYHVTPGSYSMELDYSIVPFYSDKKFTDRYQYGKTISSMTILSDHEVFSKSLYLFIGDFLVYDFQVVIEKEFFILFISPKNNGMNKELLHQIMSTKNLPWTLLTSSKSDYYYTYMSRSSLFTEDRVYVSSLTEHHIYGKPIKNNAWTMYVSKEESLINLMIGTHVSLESDEDGHLFFRVPSEFKQLVYQRTGTMKCLIVNEPDCTGTGIYVKSNTTKPIFQIPFKKNPIPIRNLIIWKYDNKKKQKCHPMVPLVQHKYPNIYDFTKMVKENDLYIEWIEPLNDVSSYDTYIQDYMDCYGSSYSEMIENSSASPYVLDYHPIEKIEVTSENYAQSPYCGDYRAWKLDKLIQLMRDNPLRYQEFYHQIYYATRKMIKQSYTYDTHPHIYERSVMDNGVHCDSADERIVYFTEPQTYIKVYNSSCADRYCALYVGGVRKSFTYNMTYGSDMYIYFPTSYITNHESIQIDIGIDTTGQSDDIRFKTDSFSKFNFSNTKFLKSHSISDLMFYDHDTQEFIPSDEVSLYLSINKKDIQFNGFDMIESFSMLDIEEELFEKQLMLFVPSDVDYIVLNNETVDHQIEDRNLHKEIDCKSISVGLSDPKYHKKYAHMVSTNFYHLYTSYIDNEHVMEEMDRILYESGSLEFNTNGIEYIVVQGIVIDLPDFKGKPDANRFRVYVNGLLQSPNNYSVSFKDNVFGGTATVTGIKLPDGKAIIEYMGFDEELLYDGIIQDLKKSGDDILYLGDLLNSSFDLETYRIFIDGYRITDDRIKILNQSDMIVIKDLEHQFTSTSNIMIYKQTMDRDPYDYNEDIAFLTKLVKTDDTFRSYMINKYTR